MSWSLTVVLTGLLLLPDPSESCLMVAGTKTTKACSVQSASQSEHGRTGHLPTPVVRPEDFIIEDYGTIDQRLRLNVTLVSSSLSDWVEEVINHDDVRVEIYYSTSMNCEYVSCPDAHNLTCIVKPLHDIHRYILLAVNVSDNKGNWKYHCLGKLQMLPRARAAMVENAKVVAVNSSTVTVTWKGTVLTEANHPVLYRVKFDAKNFNHQVERIYYSTPPVRRHQHQITGLLPHGAYNVKITVQPVSLDEAMTPTGFSSDPVSHFITMPDDVPARNPHWAPGKFSIDDCGDGCKSTSITIYWKALPEIARNGMIHYIVTVKTISETNREELFLRENVSATKTSYQIKDLPKGRPAYEVELVASTEKGINASADPSVLYLDGNALASSRPSQVESIKARDHKSILVTWKGVLGSNYSIVLCRVAENDEVENCKGQIWSLPVGKATNGNVPLALAERDERHHVGVWMDTGAAGIVWSPCVFQEGVSPKAVPPADIYSQTGHLVVKVGKYRCEDSAAPTTSLRYYINYCLTNDNTTCSGKVSKETIGPDGINQPFLYAVEPNHYYKVTIYAEAAGGRSPKLVENRFVPMSTKGRIFGEIFGGLVAALFIIGIIVSLLVYRNHVKKYPVHIEKVPIVTVSMVMEDGGNQDEELHEEDLMMKRVESSNNRIKECDTDEKNLEQEPMIRQMQPKMLTAEEEIPEEFIYDYARVTFNTELMTARFGEDQPNERERLGQAVATKKDTNETTEHFPGMTAHQKSMDEDSVMSIRSGINNNMNSASDYSGNSHFEGLHVPEADDTEMPETDDNSGDECTCLYDGAVTDNGDTGSDGDSVISTGGYSGAVVDGDGDVISNVGDLTLHSNWPDMNSSAEDLDSVEDYSKFRPSDEINGRPLVPSSIDKDHSVSGEESFGRPNDSTLEPKEFIKEGINDSGLGSNGEGSTLPVLPQLRDDFRIG